MNTKLLRAGLLSVALTAMLGRPESANAQRDFRTVKERIFNFANWYLEANAGYGDIGRLLLQAMDVDDDDIDDDIFEFDLDDRQRRLNPSGGFSWGLGAGVEVLEGTTMRIGFSRVTGELEYKDDTGDGGEILDSDDRGDIGASFLSLEAGQFFFDRRARLRPYVRAGFAVTWWGRDDDSDGSFFGEEDVTRWGATGVIGLRYYVNRRWGISVEAAGFNVGSPFSGNESFVPRTGFTIDEPTRVSTQIYRAAISYNVGRPRPFREDRDGR